MSTDIALAEGEVSNDRQRLSTDAVIETMEAMNAIRAFVAKELKPDLDYGVIPGTNNKRVLLNPGAQKIAMLFNTTPEYTIRTTELGSGHCEHQVNVSLVSRSTREPAGAGIGSCSTMEKKYRWRQSERVCPECGKAAIIKGKAEYGGGWLCWKKKDGCGFTFADTDPKIAAQAAGRVENEDIWDTRNTVLKMAKKRAMVDAALGLGCLAEMFTQDVEEHHEPKPDARNNPPSQQPPPAPRTEQPAQPPRPAIPKNADELYNRIDNFERAMVAGNHCKPTETWEWVRHKAAELGWPVGMEKWDRTKYAVVMGFIEEFKAGHRAPAKPDFAEALAKRREWLAKDFGPNLAQFNAALDEIRAIKDEAHRKAEWALIRDHAAKLGLVWDAEAKFYQLPQGV